MRRRVFALTAAILFVLSWIFPVGAGLVRNPTGLPQWWATVDVALAFVVAVAALGIQALAHGNVDKQAEQTTYQIYRSLMHAILAVGVLVMVGGDRINWANCATGFLWRTWLFLYILPWWLAAGTPRRNYRPRRGAPTAKLRISSRVVCSLPVIRPKPPRRLDTAIPGHRPSISHAA